MLVEKILGNLSNFHINGREIDYVDIEWHEVNKKILKKTSRKGKEIGIKLKGKLPINHNDILYYDSKEIVVVNVVECDAIIIKPQSMEEMGKLCYEIGNKHVPLFFHDCDVVVPYEEPLLKHLEKKGFYSQKGIVRLVNELDYNSRE